MSLFSNDRKSDPVIVGFPVLTSSGVRRREFVMERFSYEYIRKRIPTAWLNEIDPALRDDAVALIKDGK